MRAALARVLQVQSECVVRTFAILCSAVENNSVTLYSRIYLLLVTLFFNFHAYSISYPAQCCCIISFHWIDQSSLNELNYIKMF